MEVTTSAQDSGAAAAPLRDTEQAIEHARELHRRADDWCRGAEVELYVRTSSALRVGFNEGSPRYEVRFGEEQGLALRTKAEDEVGFAATSGSSEASLRWVVAACRRLGSEGPWGEPDGGDVVFDRDAPFELPSAAALESWLGQARDQASSSRSAGKGLRAGWLEVATTVETLVTPGGRVRCRTRARAWSGLTPRVDSGGAPSVRVAARRFSDLDPRAWRLALEDRATGGPSQDEDVPKGNRAVLLTPECSARLVLAMVKELPSGLGEGIPVGPGWAVADEPSAAGALFGGDFDDLGDPTARTVLADGGRWQGSLEGPGRWRRPSFRDRPQPRPFHLVLGPPSSSPLPDALLVDRLEVHPTGAAWVLLVSGRLLKSEPPWPRFTDVRIRTSAPELATRCMAGVGPPRDSHLGVVTPALLFDALPVG